MARQTNQVAARFRGEKAVIMKKICHFSSAHRGLDIRIFRKECVSLAKAGYDTHLVINATSVDVAEAALHGVTVHPLEYIPEERRFSRMFFHAWRCYRIAKKLNADLYHFHDPELIPYGLLLAWSGKKVILDAHEDLPGDIQSKEWIPLPARNLIAIVSRAVEHFGARRFSAVIAATPFIGMLFKLTAKRVLVINNYPLLDELLPSNADGVVPRDNACYVGIIDKIRGIREIVQAIATTDCNLLLAGQFATDCLRDDVIQYPGWSKVKEFGFVNRQKITEIMSQSFCGLVTMHPVPNHINSQPNKMFEYMSAGVPVIASDFPLWREIIEGNQCGLCVNPKNLEEISAAIQHLRDHPEEVTRMGENGRRAVEEKYCWNGEEFQLLSLYQSLLC